MKRFLLLNKVMLIALFCLLNIHLVAQAPFAKSFRCTTDGDDSNGYTIARDASGNIYVGGSFRAIVDFDPDAGVANLNTGQPSGNANQNGFFGKYTSAGAYVWAFKVGNAVSGSSTIVNGIAVDGAGNVYIVGEFQGTVDFDPGAGTANLTSAGSNDIFFAKYDNNGAYQWAKQIGAASSDKGLGIALDASNNVYIVGNFQGICDFDPNAGIVNITSLGGLDAFVASYTTVGVYRWAFNLGSTSSENAYQIKVDASSTNVIVCGSFQRTVDFDPGVGVVNLSSSTPASGIDVDGFVAKYTTATGAYVWARKIGGNPATTLSEEVFAVALDATDNVYVAGKMVSATIDVSGTTLTKIGSLDLFYAKYNSSGTLQWAKNIGTASNNVTPNDLYVEGTNLFMVGYFTNTIDFDPNAGVENGTSAGSIDMFFSEYSTVDGSFICKATVGGTSIDYARAVVGDGSGTGSFYVIGWFRGVNIDFNPGPGTTLLTSGVAGTSSNVFIGKYQIGNTGAGCTLTLPIKLLSFDATPINNKEVELRWITTAEINNDYFTIERSTDVVKWEEITTTKGAGNSSNNIGYEVVDSSPSLWEGRDRLFYYRLKQTDYNGEFSYSEIIMVKLKGENELNFYPNPAKTAFTIEFKNSLDKTLTISIANTIGQIVYNQWFDVQEKLINEKINVQSLSEGVYFISCKTESTFETKKIVIKR